MENLQWLKILKKVKLGDMSTERMKANAPKIHKIFDKFGKIISNKKHYKTFHMITGYNKHGYIAMGVIVALGLIAGPFPALL